MDSTFLVTEARLGPFRIGLAIDHFSNRRFRAKAGFDLESFFAPGCLTLKNKWFQSSFWHMWDRYFLSYLSYKLYRNGGGLFRSCNRVTFEEIRDFLHRFSPGYLSFSKKSGVLAAGPPAFLKVGFHCALPTHGILHRASSRSHVTGRQWTMRCRKKMVFLS